MPHHIQLTQIGKFRSVTQQVLVYRFLRDIPVRQTISHSARFAFFPQQRFFEYESIGSRSVCHRRTSSRSSSISALETVSVAQNRNALPRSGK